MKMLRRVLVRSVRAANGMHSKVFVRGFSAHNVDDDADNDGKNHDGRMVVVMII